MMTGNKGGGDIELCDIMQDAGCTIGRRTSQVGAAHLMVSLTPAETLTHLLPGHADVAAGVVGPETNVLAVLVGVKTPRPHRGVTGRGHGQLPTFTAASMTIRVPGAGIPGLEAALLIIGGGTRSAVTVVTQPDALIPAHYHPPTLSVVTGVGVGRAVTRPHSLQDQQRNY